MTRRVLLVNLGTPDAPSVPAVRRYLAEFLMDGRVLDMNPVARAALVYGAILPFRPAKSARAYQQVWGEKGSPLLEHSEALRGALATQLGSSFDVRLAMRYGEPSLQGALQDIERDGIDDILVVPLYPQFASSSTGSTLERVYAWASKVPAPPAIQVVPAFYDREEFLAPLAAVTRATLDEHTPEHVLMSFHGLPERHMKATDPTKAHCLAKAGCCDAIGPSNRFCYRAQCYATARALASRVELAPERWSVSFQSRLGRTPWIQPFTDHVIPELAKRYKRIAVVCPSFVSDCLETLEEIGIRAKEQFRTAGGDALDLVPCVNANPAWVAGLARLVEGTHTRDAM